MICARFLTSNNLHSTPAPTTDEPDGRKGTITERPGKRLSAPRNATLLTCTIINYSSFSYDVPLIE